MENRRVTLGPISQSAINSRVSGISRPSNVAADMSILKSRASMGIPANRILNAAAQPPMMMNGKRASMGVSNIVPMISRKSSLQPRSSSINNSTGTTRMADPRNISDKQFLNDSIRALLRYLTEHNFDHSISPKILSRPSNKDFSNIVLFLFKQYDPNFTCTGKFEDEVVAMFKQIGHPCQISKANITAAGTPHAWPSLLAALVWLVELLQYDDAVGSSLGFSGMSGSNNLNHSIMDINGAGGGVASTDERSATQAAFYTYLSQAYGLFMVGEDDRYTELEEKFVNHFESKNLLIKDQILALEQRNVMLNNEIEMCERRRLYLPELEQKKKEYHIELTSFQSLVEQEEKQKNVLQMKVTARQSDVDKLTSSISLLNDEISQLHNKISVQELSPEDVKRMYTQREQLESAYLQANEYKHNQLEKVREFENTLRLQVEKLADTAKNYNLIAEDLKLIPITARNSKNHNFEVEVDIRAKKREDLLKTDIRLAILPFIQSFRKELNECTQNLKSDLLSKKEILDELCSQEVELVQKKRVVESKLKKVDELYKYEKDILEQTEMNRRHELDVLEAKLMKSRDNNEEEVRLNTIHRKIEESKNQRIQNQIQHEKTRNELIEAIMEIVTQCANHRGQAQSKLKLLKDLYSERLEDCLFGRGVNGYIKMVLSGNNNNNNDDNDMMIMGGRGNNDDSMFMYGSNTIGTEGLVSATATNTTTTRAVSGAHRYSTSYIQSQQQQSQQQQPQKPQSRRPFSMMPTSSSSSSTTAVPIQPQRMTVAPSTTTAAQSQQHQQSQSGSYDAHMMAAAVSSSGNSGKEDDDDVMLQAYLKDNNRLLELLSMNHQQQHLEQTNQQQHQRHHHQHQSKSLTQHTNNNNVHIISEEEGDDDDEATVELDMGEQQQQQQQQEQYEEEDQEKEYEGEEETTDYSRLAGDANYSRILSSPLLFPSSSSHGHSTLNNGTSNNDNNNHRVTMRSRR